jgi:arginine-tRNA-protein transferase
MLVPATATPETFELYKRYQVSVHKDKPSEITMRGFERFLCNSPLGVSGLLGPDELDLIESVQSGDLLEKRRHCTIT